MMRCKNILVVEDDEGICETLKIFLELEGYPVLTAISGKDGIDILRNKAHPCLILLDLMTPAMNSWEFIDEMRKDDVLVYIPIVVVTAYAEKAAALGMRGVIKKPIDLDVVLKVVQKWCGPVFKVAT